MEVSLYRVLEARGVTPAALLGHSIGEVAAAHVAGVLTLEDACALVAARGGLMQALPSGGAMVAVEATEEEVLARLAEVGPGASIAAINGERAVVVSGEEDAVLEVARRLKASGRRSRRLRVSHAFHSPRMEPMLAPFRAVVEQLTFRAPAIRIESTVAAGGGSGAGGVLGAAGACAGAVRGRMRRLAAAGIDRHAELRPDGVLAAMAAEAPVLPMLRRGHDEEQTVGGGIGARSVGRAAGGGAAVPARGGTGSRRARRQRPATTAARARAAPGGEASRWCGRGGGRRPSPRGWPITRSAGRRWWQPRCGSSWRWWPRARWAASGIRELILHEPLVLRAAAATVQVAVGAPDEEGARPIAIHSRTADDQPWRQHASGVLHQCGGSCRAGGCDRAPAWPPPGEPAEPGALYDALAAAGWATGPRVRTLRAAWRDGERLHAEVALPREQPLATCCTPRCSTARCTRWR